MRVVRDVILGLDFLVRARKSGGEVAIAAQDLPGCLAVASIAAR